MKLPLSVEQARGEALRLLLDLVRIPAPSGGEEAAAEWVQVHMQRLGFQHVHRDAWGNVVGTRQGRSDGPTLFLDSHLDVAPVGEEATWRFPPYAGVLEQGRVYGRGAADTHASLVAMLVAVASLPAQDLCGRVVLAATVLEETLTGAAVATLLDEYRPQIFITGEPTGLQLATAQKGRATLEILAEGRAAHTSHPEQGVNAILRMLEALRRIDALPRKRDAILGDEIFTVTEIISQPYPNITLVPYGCRSRLVARLLPHESRESLMERLQAVLGSLEGVDVYFARLRQQTYTGLDVEVEDFLPGWCLPQDNPWEKRILSAFQRYGLPTQTMAAHFGTNASAAAQRGIPCFIYGPGNLIQAHAVDEWVAVQQVEAAILGYRALIDACLK